MASEQEITGPVALCLPSGRLNPAAVGFTRTPLHQPNLRGWGRTKRWEYWGVVTPGHVVGLTVSSLDYAGVHGVYVLDRESRREYLTDVVAPLARGTTLPSRCGVGRADVQARQARISFTDVEGGTWLRARTNEVDVEVFAERPEGHECLGVVVPWSDRRFQYTVKDVGRPATGRLVTPDGTETLDASTSYAVLDHGRGRWPYRVTWNWGAGFGIVGGRTVGVQVGGAWTDGTGSTENGLFLDGVLNKISEDLAWSYDRADWTRPWTIRGERVELTFEPFHVRTARTNLGVVASQVHQAFGTYRGWMAADTGERVRVDGVTGWAEEARNRW